MTTHSRDVILNGGEAAVKDRTTVEGLDVVDGSAQDAGSVESPIDTNAWVSAKGPEVSGRRSRITTPGTTRRMGTRPAPLSS